MKINLGQVLEVSASRLTRLLRDVEREFEAIPEPFRLTYDVTLNFSAPAAVPGVTSEVVSIEGVEVGDMVLVGAPVAAPAGFLPPVAEVTDDGEVTVHWFQFSGAAADPDGSGGTYKLDVFRH